MSRPILPDSSWYISEARAGRDPLLELAIHAEVRDVAVCGVVIAEVGRGLRHRQTLQRYRQVWANMVHVEATRDLWQQVTELAWHLDRRGTVLPLADIIIATSALQIDAVLLTRDRHFAVVPGLVMTDRVY